MEEKWNITACQILKAIGYSTIIINNHLFVHIANGVMIWYADGTTRYIKNKFYEQH